MLFFVISIKNIKFKFTSKLELIFDIVANGAPDVQNYILIWIELWNPDSTQQVRINLTQTTSLSALGGFCDNSELFTKEHVN